jgi:hypothetical protein
MAADGSNPLPPARPPASTPIGAAIRGIAGAIRQAAHATGTSFEYLLATAKAESNLNPKIAARTSTAAGLFQFVEQTWLATLKASGESLGYGRYAAAIERAPSGLHVVSDPALRAEIMQLRHDPAANAAMAGAFTRQNEAQLGRTLGRAPREGELYAAHFLGSGGAARLIGLAAADPTAKAAEAFPGAARANPTIFYDGDGRARSSASVLAELDRRYRAARVHSPALLAAADPAAITQALAAGRPGEIGPPIPPPAPDFHSLFHTGERRTAVSKRVAALWSAPAAESAGTTSAAKPRRSAAPRPPDRRGPLELQPDARVKVRSLFDGSV